MGVSAAGAAKGAAAGSAIMPGWGTAIGGALGAVGGLGGGGGGGGGGGAPPMPQTFNPNTPINVAPVGVNLGEILKGYEQGSSVNGGSGARIPSRYAQKFMDNAAPSVPAKSPGLSVSPILIGGLVATGLVGYLLLR